MKIFGVLAILSTLYTQGTSLDCKKVDIFSNPADITTADETCVDETTCVRPIMKDAGTYEATGSKWGCGVCTTPASCVSCDTDNCNEEPFKCLATTDYAVAATSKPCSDIDADDSGTFTPAEKKCVRPIMKDGGTYEAAGSKWGCGVCTTPASCVSCETGNCNVAPTFKCLATTDYAGEPESEVCPDRIPTGSDAFKPETTCVRPTFTDGTYTYITDGTKWGCGVCGTADNCIDACITADCNEAAKFTCHKYTVSSGAWMKNGQVDCVDVQGCHLPTPDSVTTEEDGTVYDSCGDCGSLAEGVCKKCTGVDCNDIEDHVYCKKGANDALLADLKQNFCADGVELCQRPEFSYAVVGAVAYGCGDCEDGEDAIANCKTCEESDCNSIPTEKNHKCYTYTLGDDDKWAKSVAMAVCVSGDNGVEDKCNMPADLAVKAGRIYTEGAGCGPCKDADDACTTTEAEKNVGQKAMVSLLVTILPLLYVML